MHNEFHRQRALTVITKFSRQNGGKRDANRQEAYT